MSIKSIKKLVKHKLTLVALLAFCFSVPFGAIAATLSGSLTINPMIFTDGIYQGGSYFSMTGNSNSAASLTSAGYDGIILNTNQNFVLDPDEPHPEGHPDATFGAGTGFTSITQESGITAPFLFFGSPTYVGSNSLSYQSGLTKPVVSVDHDGLGNLTAELSAWEVYWNGSAFEQGPRPVNTGPFVLATGTYDPVTSHYTLDWTSQIEGGPFNGIYGTWHLEGIFISSAIVIDDTATVAPDVVIGAGSTVGANTIINKEVTVGKNSTIGANVTINKETQLGDNTVVGDGSTINKDVIAGDDLTVGVNVTIHKDVMVGTGVIIGDNTVINKGTVIGNDVTIGEIGSGVGVFVGKDVTISSGAVILDGDTIENGTVITP